MKKGNSIVFLSISIIIMVILAGVCVFSIKEAGKTVDNAKKVVFKADVVSFRDELEQNISKLELRNSYFDRSSINLDTVEEIKEYIPSFKLEYLNYFKIKNGELVMKKTEDEKEEWVEELAFIEIEK